MEFVWFILIGMCAGWLAGQFMKGSGFGLLGNLIVGVIGALLGANPIFSTALYLLMGWVVVTALGLLVAKVPTPGLLWLLAGGLSYTAGVVFFAIDVKLRYGHLIWHFFVLAGTVCHYLAVLWYAP